MQSGERGKNPVAMTTINPRKEYCPSRGSNQRLHVLKSCTQPTELWGSALIDLKPMCFRFKVAFAWTKISYLSFSVDPRSTVSASTVRISASTVRISASTVRISASTVRKFQLCDGSACKLLYLTFSQTSPGFCSFCSTSILKTLWKKEKLCVTSNVSFFHSVFYPLRKVSAIFIQFNGRLQSLSV